MSHKRAESAGKRRKQWTAERFVAAKMANICWNFIHMFNIPQEYKQAAEYCLDQFDASGAPSLQNPICAAELERRFFPKTERAMTDELKQLAEQTAKRECFVLEPGAMELK